MSESNLATSANVEADGSIALVRIVLAMVGSAVVVGGRSTGGVWSWLGALLVVLLIAAVAAGLSKLANWLRQERFSEHFRDVVMQSADSLATLGLVLLMSEVSPAAGWVLLAVPIVISSLRASATGVLAVWAGVSFGYLAMLWFDVAQPGREGIGQALVFERPGTLLAVAACVAILTRWLQDGWVRQAEVARESEARLSHIGVIERAGRRMRELDADKVVTSCLEHGVDLGFEAVTAYRNDQIEKCVGDGEIVPAGEAVDAEPGIVDLIEWRDRNHKAVFSFSIREPRTGVVISGWNTTEVPAPQIEALTLLVGQATVNIEAAQLLGRARYQADHDPLTGMVNRAGLDRHMALAAAQKQLLAVFFIDLDYFKKTNDKYGHGVGDQALIHGARCITEAVGDVGFVARFGGDEFVVVLEGDAAKEVEQVAKRIRKAAERPLVVDDLSLLVPLSIGTAVASGPTDPDDLLRDADHALLKVKARRDVPKAPKAELDPKASMPSTTEPESAAALAHGRTLPFS
jgi:diguanylate cyclase (GGDEF)-like protein